MTNMPEKSDNELFRLKTDVDHNDIINHVELTSKLLSKDGLPYVMLAGFNDGTDMHTFIESNITIKELYALFCIVLANEPIYLRVMRDVVKKLEDPEEIEALRSHKREDREIEDE